MFGTLRLYQSLPGDLGPPRQIFQGGHDDSHMQETSGEHPQDRQVTAKCRAMSTGGRRFKPRHQAPEPSEDT